MMKNKYQEAYKWVDGCVHSVCNFNTKIEELDIIKELVDKETPVKPEWLGGAMTGEPKPYCPKCSYCVNDYYSNKYRCRECGQKLDWSDEDAED